MKHKSLVSGIIVLNAEKFIEEAIESVLAQTYDHWELLLVDDGSTDRSTEIARRYAEQHPEKVRYLEHEDHQNRGISPARNLGIQNARGDYIAFLDADDVWLPSKLAEQVALMAAQPEAAMIYGRTLIWYSWTGKPKDSQFDYFCKLGGQSDSLVSPPTLLLHLLPNQYQTAIASDALMRRSSFEKYGYFEEGVPTSYQDETFFAKVQLQASVFVSETCWTKQRCYHKNGGALTEAPQNSLERLQFLAWLRGYLLDQQVQDPKVWQAFQGELDNHSVSQVGDIILSRFPDFEIKEITFLGEGVNNRAYRINQDYIFRFPKHPVSQKSLTLEVRLLEYLKKHRVHLPAPQCEFIGKDLNQSKLHQGMNYLKEVSRQAIVSATHSSRLSQLIPLSYEVIFVGYKEIKGSFLYSEFVSQSSSEVRQTIAKDIAQFLSALHALPVSDIRKLGIREQNFGKKYYLYFYKIIERDILPQLSSEQKEIIANLFSDYIAGVACRYKPSLLHGDLNWDHILYNESESKVMGIIDFGGSFIGDPDRDFVGLWLKYGEDFIQSVLEYYGSGNRQKLMRKIKLFHCCDCVYAISQGIDQKDEATVEQGWQILKNFIVDLSQGP